MECHTHLTMMIKGERVVSKQEELATLNSEAWVCLQITISSVDGLGQIEQVYLGTCSLGGV